MIWCNFASLKKETMYRKHFTLGGYYSRLQEFFERYVFSSRKRFFLSLFIPLTLIYGATASWELPQDPDVLTIAVSAWHMGHTGSPLQSGYEQLTSKPYFGPMGSFVDAPGGVVSQYPPGAALLAAPVYALTPGDLQPHVISNPSMPELSKISIPLPSFWQATTVAIITTAAAISVLALIFLEQWTPEKAWIAAWITALGTSAWSVAADSLYLHGPAMLWIALGVYLSSQRRYWESGLAFGAAVLTRPHTAVIPAAVGLGLGMKKRQLRPILLIGLTSMLGVVALLAYNLLVFERFSIQAGYSDAFAENLTSKNVVFFLKNILGGLLDPRQGFLVLSPFFLLLLPGLFAAWRNSEDWVRVSAIGGLIYLLLQFKMNRYNPGNTTLYRYPLEALTASAPLWFAAYRYWLKEARPVWRRLWPKSVVLAIGIQCLAVWFF